MASEKWKAIKEQEALDRREARLQAIEETLKELVVQVKALISLVEPNQKAGKSK